MAVGSLKPSRIMMHKTYCASESNTSIRVVFSNRSGFDAPIGVFLAWEERGSCINIFRMTNHSRISETFTNYEAKDLLRKRQITVRSQKPSRITKQKTGCASESNTSVRVVFANRSGFDAPIGVVLAREERGSCLNIFQTKNHGRISETITNYVAKDLLHNGFDAPIGVVLAWEERGSCLNIFRTKNRGCISETFTNYEAKDLLRKWVKHVVVFAWEERGSCLNIFLTTNRVVLAWEKRGSCLNIFRTTNRGWISETFTNYEAKDLLRKNLHKLRGKTLVAQVSQIRRFALYLRTVVVLMLLFESSRHGRSVDHVLTYSGRQIGVGSLKPSRITRQKTCYARELNTSVCFVFSNRTGFDAPIAVVLSSWNGRSVDQVLTYSRCQIALGSQKPSRIRRQKTCCASESNTLVRIVFANRSGFDAPIVVVLAWEERGSCLKIFRMKNHGRISETFTNYEAKDLLRK
ncbi:uncharacterized protein G2W53_041671 [Senna tora]|uniref:Uncharacterized protein n=1 Tax=Senna tora TaxID=362788 RepID=A0A834SHE0_9FABA|nr:uncharacterized protein G2W53_041671 [Senna tora]